MKHLIKFWICLICTINSFHINAQTTKSNIHKKILIKTSKMYRYFMNFQLSLSFVFPV